jgi:hypothetical protein
MVFGQMVILYRRKRSLKSTFRSEDATGASPWSFILKFTLIKLKTRFLDKVLPEANFKILALPEFKG